MAENPCRESSCNALLGCGPTRILNFAQRTVDDIGRGSGISGAPLAALYSMLGTCAMDLGDAFANAPGASLLAQTRGFREDAVVLFQNGVKAHAADAWSLFQLAHAQLLLEGTLTMRAKARATRLLGKAVDAADGSYDAAAQLLAAVQAAPTGSLL